MILVLIFRVFYVFWGLCGVVLVSCCMIVESPQKYLGRTTDIYLCETVGADNIRCFSRPLLTAPSPLGL